MPQYRRAPLYEIIFRLLVYAACAGFCLVGWLLLLCALDAVGNASGQTPAIYVPFRWQVDTARPARQDIAITHGETIAIEPTYITYGSPVDLSSCYEVLLRYRSADMAAGTYYAATGTVTSATNGQVRILFGPAQTGTNSLYSYDIKLTGADSASLKASGRIKIAAGIGTTLTPISGVITGRIDFANIEVDNPDAAPFANAGDLLAIDNRLDGHDTAISNVTDLVGDGVAGVTSNLQEHIASQTILDTAQDDLIDLALESANMGGDTTGVSTNTTVVSTRGRLFPAEDDVPQNLEAIVWDAVLGGMTWGSVDLTAIWAAINNLIANAVTQTYVDTEVSRVEGMVDGNDHVLQLTEAFESLDWLEIASGVWQHNTYGWLASNASIVGGQLTLNADYGTITIDVTNHVSKVGIAGTASKFLVSQAETLDGPWTGYDTAADNIPYTNQFAIRIWNSGGTSVTLSRLDLYSWAYPERVGAARDFAGLTLRVDTPAGSDIREAANVDYIRNLPATGSISGTFATGFSVDKFKTYPISTAGLLNGMGMVYYSSVNEFRPVDVATQFELDAAITPLCTIASYNALAARMTAAEAGTSIPLNGEVVGTAASNRVTQLLGANLPAAPAPAQHSLVMGASGTWELKSILSSNIVYAAGTNDIASVPAESAAFYRADYQGTNVMVMVLDQQVVAWFGPDGMVLPYGTLDVIDQLIKANIQAYDGSLLNPAFAFLSEPGMGWHRASTGGGHVWRFGKEGNAVLDLGGTGLTMATGKQITLADGSRAVSLAEFEGGVAEADPLSLHVSSTTQSWSNAGGSYTNEGVVATSPLLSNGVAAVSYTVAAGNGMQPVVEMADSNGTDWEPFTAFAYPGYVRISLTETVPSPTGMDTTISNITATSWTRPDLVGQTNDTAGQILLVDPAVADRQPVNLGQLNTGLAGVQPSGWAAYPATTNVNLGGNVLLAGQGFSFTDVNGLSVISYTDMFSSTNGMQWAVNMIPVISATPGYRGLTIAALSVDGGTGTVSVATNGVTAQPLLQWTPGLQPIVWQTLTPVSETYPSTNAAGHYEIVAVLPNPNQGYMRVVQADGTSRADVHMPLYVEGARVATTTEVAAVSARVDAIEAWPAASFAVDGTNLLWVLDGVTNRVVLEVWP